MAKKETTEVRAEDSPNVAPDIHKGPVAIVLKNAIALGNGDRKAGEKLCVIEAATGVELHEIGTALCNSAVYDVQPLNTR